MSVDAAYRLLYRAAFRVLRLWWWLRRPSKAGAAVAFWQGGRLLVVRTSYHDRVDLPGGGVTDGEDPAAAAARELREETGIELPSAALGEPRTFRHLDLDRRLTNHVFAWEAAAAPSPVPDGREVVWAGFVAPAELGRLKLSPLLRAYLAERAGLAAQPPSGTRQISRA